jgi:flagellar protein FlaG
VQAPQSLRKKEMAANIDKVPSIANSIDPPPQRREDRDTIQPATPAAPVEAPADYRLVIEEDKSARTFVYKTVNWATGEVVGQLPREELLRLRENADYVAGQVVKTKA